MANHLSAPCMLVTAFGMLVHVAVLAFRSLALARGVERHDCPRKVLVVSSLISVTRIYSCGASMRLRTRPNHALQPTTGRRTAQFFITPTSHPAATPARASSG